MPTNGDQPNHCPICNSVVGSLDGAPSAGGNLYYNCPICGQFGLTGSAQPIALRLARNSPENVPAFSYELQLLQERNVWPLLRSDAVERLFAAATLPTVQQQADNLVLSLGVLRSDPGKIAVINPRFFASQIGAASPQGVRYIAEGLKDRGLVKLSTSVERTAPGLNEIVLQVGLTFAGWERHEELRRGAASGWQAFMAMPFGIADLDRLVDDHLRVAVEATGFQLRRLDDNPKAGLIDDRLRVEIRKSRFLIADLTHNNNGAYWEAGYAEGLGKPVIYTCETSVFNDAKRRPHFDTNHHLTVVWDSANPNMAVEQLKSTIRATLPEARQQDTA